MYSSSAFTLLLGQHVENLLHHFFCSDCIHIDTNTHPSSASTSEACYPSLKLQYQHRSQWRQGQGTGQISDSSSPIYRGHVACCLRCISPTPVLACPWYHWLLCQGLLLG